MRILRILQLGCVTGVAAAPALADDTSDAHAKALEVLRATPAGTNAPAATNLPASRPATSAATRVTAPAPTTTTNVTVAPAPASTTNWREDVSKARTERER